MRAGQAKEGVPLSVYVVAMVCGGVFVLAGLMKAGDVSALYPSLLYDGVAVRFLLPLSVTVVALELVVGLSLLAGWRLRVFLGAGLVLVFLFTGQLVWFLIGGEPPECGCFGRLIEAELSNQDSIYLGLARNGLLGSAIGYGFCKAP